MRIALEVWSSDFAQVERTCRHAEQLGFDALYYGESPHDLNLECWATLAALARTTERIRLGPVIANVLPSYRSTLLLGRQAATVAAISGHRLDFRTGVGAAAPFGRAWWERRGVQYPDYEQRLTDLHAALDVLPELWGGLRRAPTRGHAEWAGAGPMATSEPPIPITIAARGRRAMRLAAAHAQVWETSFCTPPEFEEQDARMAEALGGRHVVRSLEVDGFVAPTRGGVTHLLERVRAERGTAEDLDRVFERALVGTPSQAGERLADLARAGVDQVVVALHDPHDPVALDALALARAAALA